MPKHLGKMHLGAEVIATSAPKELQLGAEVVSTEAAKPQTRAKSQKPFDWLPRTKTLAPTAFRYLETRHGA